MYPSMYGAQQSQQVLAQSAAQAYALDAADGVLDGKCFGASVGVQGPGSRPQMSMGAPMGYGQPMAQPMGYAQPMMAPPSMGYAQPSMGYAQPSMGYAQPSMGYGMPQRPGMMVAQSAADAFALDAADGVIDGKCFGSNVGVGGQGAPAFNYPVMGGPRYF